ncbi:MAG TPA: hypothetical protein VFA38_00590 [Nitrospirales bacterium]|nr:hypothetical protein [Nitrospirales bacterium]
MALDQEWGAKMLGLVTSRYNDRHWRKKIEKTLSLTPAGLTDETQRQLFLYLKTSLKAYKSRRADPDSWIVGGYATQEAIERAKYDPTVVGQSITKEDVSVFGRDPGTDVNEAWWDEMLVAWFDQPDQGAEETPSEIADAEEKETKNETKT